MALPSSKSTRERLMQLVHSGIIAGASWPMRLYDGLLPHLHTITVVDRPSPYPAPPSSRFIRGAPAASDLSGITPARLSAMGACDGLRMLSPMITALDHLLQSPEPMSLKCIRELPADSDRFGITPARSSQMAR